MKRGLTLIELVITVSMFAVLTGVTLYLFRAVLISWSGGERRAGIDIVLDRAIEEVARDLRKAKDIKSVNGCEIRFTKEEDKSDNHYIFYLYNEGDRYPPAFIKASYELRKASLTPDINGGLAEWGDIIIKDVVPPPKGRDPKTGLSIGEHNVVSVILNVQRGEEILTSGTKVRPRNL